MSKRNVAVGLRAWEQARNLIRSPEVHGHCDLCAAYWHVARSLLSHCETVDVADTSRASDVPSASWLGTALAE
jgi:hypothetical protein